MEYPLFIYWQFHSCEQCAWIITPSFPLPLSHMPPTCALPTSYLLLFASVAHLDRLVLLATMLTDLGGLICAGNHGYSEVMGAVVPSGSESSSVFPELWVGDTEVPLRAEHSVVTFSTLASYKSLDWLPTAVEQASSQRVAIHALALKNKAGICTIIKSLLWTCFSFWECTQLPSLCAMTS